MSNYVLQEKSEIIFDNDRLKKSICFSEKLQ